MLELYSKDEKLRKKLLFQSVSFKLALDDCVISYYTS